MKEYRNAKRIQQHKYGPVHYECELWIDNKFIQKAFLTEVQYRERILMIKLETLLDAETFKEVEDVLQLKYEEGTCDGMEY